MPYFGDGVLRIWQDNAGYGRIIEDNAGFDVLARGRGLARGAWGYTWGGCCANVRGVSARLNVGSGCGFGVGSGHGDGRSMPHAFQIPHAQNPRKQKQENRLLNPLSRAFRVKEKGIKS